MSSIDQSALQKLLDLIGGDKASLKELIDSFLTEGPTLVDAMQSAKAEASLEKIGRAAHTLKSSARDFGASALGEQCAILEQQCKTGEATDIESQIAGISENFASAQLELEEIAKDYT